MCVTERAVISIDGVVQGVGFRPFVYREAVARNLRGFVRNDAAGVLIDIEGGAPDLADFLTLLETSPPPLAHLGRVRREAAPPAHHPGFRIAQSDAGTRATAMVLADVATCDACLAECLDPLDRRHRYPFTNCTHCGPRFTIIERVPYDRAGTTMAGFPVCAACQAEYDDPSNRRFHAQPIACPDCGPVLRFRGADGVELAADGALDGAVGLLEAGGILALKGLGGYHLACDATRADAVRTLRSRKARDAKPLAVMADVSWVDRLANPDAVEMALLRSSARPIVLLARRADAPLADNVAPGVGTLGLMLPYTPLHHLLVAGLGRPVVLTSGNRADEPIATDDLDALEHLAEIADGFLLHDRPIAMRADDSVTRVVLGKSAPIRRSRGMAPLPVPLARTVGTPILGVGGQQKNTFCLLRGDVAVLSPHIGDMDHPDARQAWRDSLDHLGRLFDVTPTVVAHDLHPDYASTSLALALPAATRVGVQHHHAHLASLMAEHRLDQPMIGVVFDGAGLGTDGAVWGGEFLVGDARAVARRAHLAPVRLPGGDRAARRPDRMALAHLWRAYDGKLPRDMPAALAALADADWHLLPAMLGRGFQSPLTTSAGRLFDAVAALCGIRRSAAFEGQAAMELEAVAHRTAPARYAFDLREGPAAWVLDPAPVVRAVTEDVAAGMDTGAVAGAFHRALADGIVQTAARLRDETGITVVGLTGGVFQNALLVELATSTLTDAGFGVYRHQRVPCNDGGLSLGQAWVAAALHPAAGD